MTSWAGIWSVTVRRLTRTIRSIAGSRKISPGPRWLVTRPRRKTTPRSYSRSTRTRRGGDHERGSHQAEQCDGERDHQAISSQSSARRTDSVRPLTF